MQNDFFQDRETIKQKFNLMKCESIIDFDEAYYRVEDMNSFGVLALTDFRLIFKYRAPSNMTKFHEEYFKIPLFHIAKVEKNTEKKNFTKHFLEISLKDTRVLKFIIMSDKLKFYANLNSSVFPKDLSAFYPFSKFYLDQISQENSFTDGWKIYDPIEEYERQGILSDENIEKIKLRVSMVNRGFKMCSTYPEIIITHKEITDEELKEASNFRTKNWLPVLSYYYGKNVLGK